MTILGLEEKFPKMEVSHVTNTSLIDILNASACTWQDNGSSPNNCTPGFMQNKWLEAIFLTNIFCIIAIGGIGNLLLILSVIYVFFRYPATRGKYPWLKNPLTILILHLSFCDFLYCIFGLPFITLPFIYNYFPLSETVCHNTALFRNLNAFAEFSTIAVIALLRLKGLIKERLTSSCRRDCLMTPCKMVLICCFTWFLSFIIISPTVFEVGSDPESSLKLDFGKFGYNKDVGICNVAPGASTKRSMAGFAFSVGFLVPCLLINISYITIFCLLKHRSNQTTTILGRQRKVMDKVSKMLLIICISYLLFCGQLAPIEWADTIMKGSGRDTKAAVTLLSYSWYWWNYTIHFLVLSFSFEDFKKIYALFLKDMFYGIFFWLRPRGQHMNALTGVSNQGFQVNNIYVFGGGQHEIINSVSVHENSICIIRSVGGGGSTQHVECINEIMVGGSGHQLEELNAGNLLFMYTSTTYSTPGSTPCTPGLIKQSKQENVQTIKSQAKKKLERSYTI